MASVDRPTDTPPVNLPPRTLTPALSRAIDETIVAGHTLRHSLAADHLPFSASLAEGVTRYGEGPLFGLWLACRAIEALRVAVEGKDET